jgi:hypothetical protein
LLKKGMVIKMKRLFSTAIALFLILALTAGCVTEIPDAYEPDNTPDINEPDTNTPDTRNRESADTPLMWRATAQDGQIMYIFGSIHAGSEDLYPLPAYVMDAFYRSGYLAVEADIVALESDFAAIMEMMNSLMYEEGTTIVDDIGEDLYERALTAVSELEEFSALGFTAETLTGFKPYFWTDMLTAVAVERAGMDLDLGLDKFFIREAMEREMGILEIESVASQMDMLLGLSPALQSLLLEEALNMDKAVEGLEELYRLWRIGDEAALKDLIYEVDEEYSEEQVILMEEYMDALLTQRDLHMADVAESYMAEGKTVFYVVGLAHLLGEDSVIGLLGQRGYTIELVR